MYNSLIQALKDIANDPIRRVCSHMSFKFEFKPTRTINPNAITTVNGIRDIDKFNRIVEDFRKNGWRGRPILAWNDSDGHWVAYTGSHRIYAARKLGIKVPICEIPNEVMQKAFNMLDAHGDNSEMLKDNTDELRVFVCLRKLADDYGMAEFGIPKRLMGVEIKGMKENGRVFGEI